MSSGKKTTIRQMEIDDISAVYRLGEKHFTSEDFPTLYRTWDPYEVTEYFSTDPSYCLVAEQGDNIVGFTLATTFEKEGTAWKKYGYLAWILIDEDFQGMHIGRRLYRELEKRWRNDGARMIIVETGSDNQEAIAFLEATGFSPTGEHVWLAKTLRRSPKKPST
ncbi:GNAT family N-acetyltransferase [Chloroflexota bacterium]